MPLSELDRRRFIQICAAGSVGLTLGRARRSEAFAPLIALLVDFSIAVASSVVAALLVDYLRSLRDQAAYRERILQTNDSLAHQGFIDQSRSPVYCSTASDRRIYYPVVNSNCSCLNFAAPFFRDSRADAPVTTIQAPQMHGINNAAQMLRATRAPNEVADYLVPSNGLRTSTGTPQSGYDGPLEYESQAGHVLVKYRAIEPHFGAVAVKVRRRVDHFPLVNDEWGFKYA